MCLARELNRPTPDCHATRNVVGSATTLSSTPYLTCSRMPPGEAAPIRRQAQRQGATGESPLPLLCAGRRATPLGEAAANRRDDPRGDVIRIAAGTEGVGPLLVAQATQEIARPEQVICGDTAAHELLVPAVEVELDEAVLEAIDEPGLFEERDVVAARLRAAGLSQCGAEVSRDYRNSRRPAGGRYS